MKLAKRIADYVLEKETMIKVDTPLSVYVDTFIYYGEQRGVNGAEAFMQHLLDTNWMTENYLTDNEFPDIPGQVNHILDRVEVTDKARELLQEVKE